MRRLVPALSGVIQLLTPLGAEQCFIIEHRSAGMSTEIMMWLCDVALLTLADTVSQIQLTKSFLAVALVVSRRGGT